METAGNQIDSNRKFLEIMVRLCQYVLMRRVPIAWVMRMCSVASTKRSKNQNPGLNLTIRRPDFLLISCQCSVVTLFVSLWPFVSTGNNR